MPFFPSRVRVKSREEIVTKIPAEGHQDPNLEGVVEEEPEDGSVEEGSESVSL